MVGPNAFLLIWLHTFDTNMTGHNKFMVVVQWVCTVTINNKSPLLRSSFQWHWADAGLGFVVQDQDINSGIYIYNVHRTTCL